MVKLLTERLGISEEVEQVANELMNIILQRFTIADREMHAEEFNVRNHNGVIYLSVKKKFLKSNE